MGERANSLVRGAGALKRRGLLAGVAALVGAGLARATGVQRVEATHSPGTGSPGADSIALHIGQTNPAGALTTLNGPLAIEASSSPTGLQVSGSMTGIIAHAQSTSAIRAIGAGAASGLDASSSSGIGIRAVSTSGLGLEVTGVNGINVFASSSGVVAQANSGAGVVGSSASNTGVSGTSQGGIGVYGGSQSNVGVFGDAADANSAVFGRATGGPGVFGTSTGGSGVVGSSTHGDGVTASSTNSIGVRGTSVPSFGVLGISSSSVGVYGQSNSNSGLVGRSETGAGIFASSGSGPAGQFQGPVFVQGSFTVTGGAKSAAVPHPDGSQRRVYCQESPEPWFEDVDEAKLVGGRAEVKLDGDFAAIVRDGYHVFLTPRADCKGLYVASQGPGGFEVRELQNGTSSLPFSYRVMARRKDIAGPRLERVAIPRDTRPPGPPNPPPLPRVPDRPELPALPARPEMPEPRPRSSS